MEGIEKLQIQVLEMNDYNVSSIFEYLKTRIDLYEKFNNEEKSIQEMYDYICSKAKPKSKNNVAMVADKLVYTWAINYFLKSNDELGIKSKKDILTTPAEVVEKENKKKTKEEETNKEKISEEKQLEDNQITLFQEVQK